MSRARRACTAAALIASVCGLLACGGGGPREAVVIHTGSAGITNASIAHWMSVMAPQHLTPVPPHFDACVSRQRTAKPGASTADLRQACLVQYDALRRQVLSFLISSRWLIGEAAAQGIAVSPEEVTQRLQQKRRSFASEAEFKESLRAIAHTPADYKLEIEAELANEKLRSKLIEDEPKLTAADVAAYYHRNFASYHIPEERYFDIAESFPSAAKARKAMREAKAGKPLDSLHEQLPRKPYSDYNGEKRIIYEAIFKAPIDVVTGPIRLNSLYFVIEVTRIVPAHVESLAQVKGSIEKKLLAERRRKTLSAFIATWRARWSAKTNCDSGYVVQKCSEYGGAKTAEEPLTFN